VKDNFKLLLWSRAVRTPTVTGTPKKGRLGLRTCNFCFQARVAKTNRRLRHQRRIRTRGRALSLSVTNWSKVLGKINMPGKQNEDILEALEEMKGIINVVRQLFFLMYFFLTIFWIRSQDNKRASSLM
jgi:hypothetical protein